MVQRREIAERYIDRIDTLLEEGDNPNAECYMNALYHMYEPETRFELDYLPPGVEAGIEHIDRQASELGAEHITSLTSEMLDYYQKPIYWMEGE